MIHPVVKSSFSPALFLGVAALLTVSDALPAIAFGLATLGVIQLLNAAAPRLPYPRCIHWVHASLFELFALLGVAFLRMIPLPQKKGRGKGQPILLIHGYMHFGGVWLFQKRWLEALGLGPIYTISLGHPFRSIALYAEKVKKKAEAIAQETGRQDLMLIGHSMGGLVASYYATRLASPGSVTDVVTIASPLAGTPMAWIGLGPNAREMRPRSLWIQELQKAIEETSAIRFYHIATHSDALVIPGISAVLEKNPHFVFEDLGHTSLLYSRRVSQKIAHWVKK